MALTFAAFQLNAQSPRMVMVEEATQASCPPCFSFNPGVIALVDANEESVVFLAYQVWWPGYDPMYLDNPDEVDIRIPYYGITGAPSIVMQGANNAQTFNQSQINSVHSQMSEFDMEIEASIVDGTMTVTGEIAATMAASGDLRLRIAIAESLISIEDAPGGTNGETEYHHVFKKFIGGAEGIQLDNFEVGDTYTINESFDLSTLNIYNYGELEVAAWIQNDDTRFVHQAAKDASPSITVQFATNATGGSVSGLPESVCAGETTVTPSVEVQNGGNDDLTAVDIFYSVNGGAEQMVSWTGSLTTYEKEEVTLDPISFNAEEAGNVLTIRMENPNGVEDENLEDNTVEQSIELAASTQGFAEITLVTDNYGNETYWQVTNSMGTVVASGGNAAVGLTNIGNNSGSAPADPNAYGNNQTITEEIAIDITDCYTLTVTDYYGDGMCCAYGNGSFQMRDHEGNLMFAGGEFTALTETPMNGEMVVSTVDPAFVASFEVAPNPVVDRAQVTFSLENGASTALTVLNNLGQVVSTQNLGNLPSGTQNVSVDMSGLPAGVYMINIVSGDITGTKKVLKANR